MRASWSSASTGTCVALVSCAPSTGQKPASSGYSRPQAGQAFIQTGALSARGACSGSRSRRARLAAVPGHTRAEVQDAVAARTLLELVFAGQALEKHRGQAHVASRASAVGGEADRGAATTADRLVAPVQHRRHVGDQTGANRFFFGDRGVALSESTYRVAFDRRQLGQERVALAADLQHVHARLLQEAIQLLHLDLPIAVQLA